MEGKITEGHARAILMVGSDAERQRMMYQEIITTGINSRDAEVRSREILGRPVRAMTPRIGSLAADPELRLAQAKLEEMLGTRVVLHKKGERGKIVVEFFSEEELKNILGKIVREI
jgi:ParB family chromosome partitioning protein